MKNKKQIMVTVPDALIEAGYGEEIISEAISGHSENNIDWLHECCKSIHHTRRMREELKKLKKRS